MNPGAQHPGAKPSEQDPLDWRVRSQALEEERDSLLWEVRLLAANVERESQQKLKAWRALEAAGIDGPICDCGASVESDCSCALGLPDEEGEGQNDG